MNAEHLNGAINETLRLHPPVPSGLPRLTPPEGITIGDTFIPGDTTLMLPYWSMGRCSSPFVPFPHTYTHTPSCRETTPLTKRDAAEKIYPRAKEFIPERWYSSPNLVPHKEAWAPFSLGTHTPNFLIPPHTT
jgi:cytochrome P450